MQERLLRSIAKLAINLFTILTTGSSPLITAFERVSIVILALSPFVCSKRTGVFSFEKTSPIAFINAVLESSALTEPSG